MMSSHMRWPSPHAGGKVRRHQPREPSLAQLALGLGAFLLVAAIALKLAVVLGG